MIKTKITDFIKKAVGGDIEIEVFIPENEQFGHYFTNIALKLAKIRGENPLEIAEKILTDVKNQLSDVVRKIEIASPGFINFWLKPEVIQKEFVEIYKAGNKWGKPAKNKKQTIVIDYSHPNIAKPMSVAHLRSTIIGQALYNIFKFAGWKTIGDNHLGDWGRQFGALIAAIKFNKIKNIEKITIADLMKMYVDYAVLMKTDEKFEEMARVETKKLQQGDIQNIKIWRNLCKLSLDEFKKIYKLLEVDFDYYLGESFYNPMLSKVVAEALDKKIAEKSDGAVVIYTNNHAPFIIKKSDGAYLYSTTDLAAIKYRIKKFRPDMILYVVDNGQTLHFEQLFKSAKALGYVKNEKLEHVKFGLILSDDLKKMSTRAGKHIPLEDLICESVERARKIVERKNPVLSKKDKEKIAKAVGVGAVKYNDLSQNRISDIAFNWDKMLNFEGNSAPYLQYTYARLKSILRKGGIIRSKFDAGQLREKIELDLILETMEFPDVIKKIETTHYPHYLSDYLYKLAKSVNNFYQTTPVLKADKETRSARLALILTASDILKTGLTLLGIKTLEKI